MNSNTEIVVTRNWSYVENDPTYSFFELAHIINIYSNLNLPITGIKDSRRISTFGYRLKAAWKVFTGKADALVW